MKRGWAKSCDRYFGIHKYVLFNISKRDIQKNCASYFEILKFVFFNIWKGNNQNMLFLTFQKEIRKKTVPGFLELISIFVLIFGKGISKKLWICWGSCVCFFNIWKRNKEKTGSSILRFVNILFFKFQKGISKTTLPGVFRFVSMFSLILKKWGQQKCFSGF